MSKPISWVSVCSGTRLNNRYTHTAFFPDEVAQKTWFLSKTVKEFKGYTYLRKNWAIKVEASMQEANTWDYLYFANPYPAEGGGNHTGKIWYYFITNIQYVNENTVELSLELDVLQTYLFDFQLLPCYVDRMHSTTDGIGENTVEEGLAVGEYVVNSQTDTTVLNDLCILVQATEDPGKTSANLAVQALPYKYNGVFSGIRIYAVDGQHWQEWGNRIDTLHEEGKSDCIVSMWMYPECLVRLGGENEWGDNVLCKTVNGAGFEAVAAPGRPSTLNGYNPKNKKLLGYPYSFLYATNNQGGSAVYRYERFTDPTDLTFTISGALGADAAVHMWPANYNGVEVNYHEGLGLSGFPTCAWDSDTYKLWLAQNQNQHNLAANTAGLKIFGGAAAVGFGLMSGNLMAAGAGAGAAISGVQQIMEMEAQRHDMEIVPPQARGNHSASVNVSFGKQLFTFQRKTVTAEYARKIDDYFTMYGYKTGRCLTPKFNHRKSHVYVKTVDCKIKGSFCAEDSARIESIFDKGVTFWRDPNGLGDYTRDNSII